MEKLDPKNDGTSNNIVKENIEKLKQIFPDVFSEDKVDCDKLKEVIGDYAEDNEERYNFTWYGKSQARRIAQTPSTGTLRPCKDESKNWDNTQNLFIEGDNLEVLKLLQKTYHKKVKMIYIDPPYNTGNEFIYPDNYKDNLDTYLKYTGQKDSEGYKFSTNTESVGRYHTNWLNMMYPRLKLARNLLRDDGVVLISIGEDEIYNLRSICNEIFGEENYYSTINWTATTKAMNAGSAKYKLQKSEEYILVYGKVSMISHEPFNLEFKGNKEYIKTHSDGRKYRLEEIQQRKNIGIKRSEKMVFEICGVMPKENYRWTIGEETARNLEALDDVIVINGKPTRKIYEQDEASESYYPFWSNFSDSYGTSESGKSLLFSLLGENHGFETVKPLEIINKLLFHFTDNNDLILDFFAGSGTSAHAVMFSNAKDNGTCKFIMVQLPERCAEDSEAYKAGYKTIAEIGKERIRRAGDKILEENKEKEGIEDLDVGFKVFKLDSSNIKSWDADFDNLDQALFDAVHNIKDERTEDDVLYEILLKYGLDLTLPIEERKIADKTVYSIGLGALVICLDSEITIEVVEGIGKLKEELNPEVMRVVFKDNGFKDDVIKTNAIQVLKQYSIEDVKSL